MFRFPIVLPAVATDVPAPVKGALWMLVSAAALAGLTGVVRHMSAGLHPFEIAFFRSFFGLLILAPWLMRSGLGVLRTKRLGLYTLRCALGVATMLMWFTAISMVPLADAVALGFTSPLFVILGAALFLGEVVRGRRLGATLCGFAGALIILRPGSGVLDLGAVLVLLSAVTLAGANLSVKELSRTEPVQAIVTYMVIFMVPLTFIPALLVWQTPTPAQLAELLGLAAVATLGNYAMTRAVAVADASSVMPYDYARLPFAALIGFFVFGETSDAATWIGAGVIAVASLYLAHHESKAEQRR
ncbi:MAG: DMT family transporter [Alphaproteobacteria bacterium]|jgi:S-adenosylmethionine uptake transporter|nr:DMT family transporter [Alphaproteobacteria bacterium]MDP7669852.1 DMT family transporter [Alphaproteobacteria bacterium]